MFCCSADLFLTSVRARTLKNTAQSYGWLAKLLHWVIALLLVGLVYAGLTFNGMERGPERTELAALHKSMALLTLALMTLRLVWKFMNARPAAPPVAIPAETWLSRQEVCPHLAGGRLLGTRARIVWKR